MLSKEISIVIPCKNESSNIYDCLELISKQEYIDGCKIFIADDSDSQESFFWIDKAKADFSNLLSIQILPGGYPAKARLEGSKKVKTPYVLFLDADIMLNNPKTLVECFFQISASQNDLLTVPFETEKKWDWIFRIFWIFQLAGKKIGTSFAVGGFQLWNTNAYWKTGGYVGTQKFAEDYWVSSRCNKKKFMILSDPKVWTSARRFRKKGILFMFFVIVKTFINRRNPEFFEEDHNYWK